MSVVVPKVFISYSWSNTKRVIELAERLVDDGVDVLLDKWELKEGHDKYVFMERSVTDPTVSKVLIICDKEYAQKANERRGGVGDETMVISPEVYKKVDETKYIPIIFERDENGEAYTPTYLKSRIYIDLSNDGLYEESYEKLLRNLHNKPACSKPVLGKIPEYLNDENVNLSKLKILIRQIELCDGKNQAKIKGIYRKFNDEFVRVIFEFNPSPQDENFSQKLLQQIDAAKPLRDLFLDYVEVLIKCDLDVGDILGEFFEQIYNGTYKIEERDRYSEYEFEFFRFMIWELFICTTAVLLYYENYRNLYDMLNRTYFLRKSPCNEAPHSETFVRFRSYNCYIDEHIKLNSEKARLLTLAGDIVVKREKKPIITKAATANADIILYQLSCVYDLAPDSYNEKWFPILYPYLGAFELAFGLYDKQPIWSKMVSLKHCKKLFPLFNITHLSQLIDQIKKNKYDHNMRYRNYLNAVPAILNNVQIEEIGSRP